ncbi:hypothetical protein N658DRAFT_42992 [Parathielavia hyrcaniae]|uniref:Uncharacterized protein n=1 Tax=Parathielavia hyrcaniae TaxID=113614 RepID=A0AAN6Q1Q9_9PEZI|nr:hypothetical protein N658DRAFT_42992 [Parathielavia hyrcaniae]
MSSAASTPTATDGFPSFEASWAVFDWPTLTASGKRLRWTLDDPLESAIPVGPGTFIDPTIPDEPYHRVVGTVDHWHAILRDPFTEPKLSSITVGVEPLQDWESIGSRDIKVTTPTSARRKRRRGRPRSAAA